MEDINNFDQFKVRRFFKLSFSDHYLDFTKNITSFCTREYDKKLRNEVVCNEKKKANNGTTRNIMTYYSCKVF